MKTFLLSLFVFMQLKSNSQLPPSPDSMRLLLFNQHIDDLVIKQNTISLDSLYADDFVFSHGSGRIEGKANWLKTVSRNNYPVRRHDSVTVQQHSDVAVLRGKMYIERIDKDKTAKYQLRYIRVYVLRSGRWKLLSHTTFEEIHF